MRAWEENTTLPDLLVESFYSCPTVSSHCSGIFAALYEVVIVAQAQMVRKNMAFLAAIQNAVLTSILKRSLKFTRK